jgi:hypothetical protein
MSSNDTQLQPFALSDERFPDMPHLRPPGAIQVHEQRDPTDSSEDTPEELARQEAQSYAQIIWELWRDLDYIQAGSWPKHMQNRENGWPERFHNQGPATEEQLLTRARESVYGSERTSDRLTLVLSGGGPACRLVARISGSRRIDVVAIEGQHWFTPWIPIQLSANEAQAARWFAGLFL